MKKILANWWPQLLLILLVFTFFARLYFPSSFFYTPDFGISDVLHLNLPQKLELATSLKHFRLPLWTELVGQGYPTFAQGLVGAFYIPNLVLFGFLPLKIAFPTSYLVTYIVASLGMYSLLRYMKLGSLAAVFGSITFTFSAAMIMRIPHLNLIESLSLLPWILLVFMQFLKDTSLKKAMTLTFLLCQLLMVGFVQIYVYFVVLLLILVFLNWLMDGDNNIRIPFSPIILVLIFSLTLSAVQVLPSFELTKLSAKSSGLDPNEVLGGFPLKPADFLTYINPFILGNASLGTKNDPNFARAGHFLENTAYIGLIPLILALYAVFRLFVKRPKNVFFNLLIILVVTILLSLGRYSPTMILFLFPPFSYFRVPARFILFSQFLMVILAAWGLKIIADKLSIKYQKIVYFCVIFLTIGDLFFRWWNFHPIAAFDDWFKGVRTAQVIDLENQTYRIDSFDPNVNWNDVFEKSGWKNKVEYYRFFLNSMLAGSNEFFGESQFVVSGNSGLTTRRYDLQLLIVQRNMQVIDGKILVGEKNKQTFDLYAVKYLISALPIGNPGYREIYETSFGKYHYYVYESDSARPRASLFYEYSTVSKMDDYREAFEKQDLKQKVILEKDIGPLEVGQGLVTITKSEDNRVSLDVDTSKKALMVLADSYYPGWIAKVDSMRTDILPANINSRAIIVPEGKHKVEFVYRPKSFEVGALVSGASSIVWLLLWFRPKILDFRKERLFKNS